MLMEARQNLEHAIELSCCAEIQIDRRAMATLQMRHVLRSVYGDDESALKDYVE